MTKWDEHDPLYDDTNLSENEEIKTSIKKVKGGKMKKYIRIKSNCVQTIILPLEVAKEHLQAYYWNNIEDWFNIKEVLEIDVVEMSEENYKKLPEWEP